MRIVNVSVNSSDPRVMIDPVRSVAEKEGIDVTVDCYNAYDCDDDPLKYRGLVESTKDADLVIIRCMTDPTRFGRFETYESVLKESDGYVLIYSGNPDVKFMYRDLFKGTDEEFIELSRYVGYRGAENDRGIVYWLHSKLGGGLEVPPPVVQRTDGIYHPDFDRDISLEDYLKTLDPSKPTAGILFVGSYWIYHNTKHIDHLIRTFETAGMNTIPVFFSSSTATLSYFLQMEIYSSNVGRHRSSLGSSVATSFSRSFRRVAISVSSTVSSTPATRVVVSSWMMTYCPSAVRCTSVSTPK